MNECIETTTQRQQQQKNEDKKERMNTEHKLAMNEENKE